MGIQNPERVYLGESLPSFCPYVTVESAYSESGHLRTYLELTLYRIDWKCVRPEGAKSKRAGRWFANSTQFETRREWKIEEEGWVKFVPVGDGVPYEDAELIILAIKHHQLLNRLPANTVPLQIPEIDPMEITSIRVPTNAARIYVQTNAARTYEVESSTGASGKIYDIKISDRSVELVGVRIWIV